MHVPCRALCPAASAFAASLVASTRTLRGPHCVRSSYGMRRVGDPSFTGQLLESALRHKRWELARALLAGYDSQAVTGIIR